MIENLNPFLAFFICFLIALPACLGLRVLAEMWRPDIAFPKRAEPYIIVIQPLVAAMLMTKAMWAVVGLWMLLPFLMAISATITSTTEQEKEE